MDNIMCFFMGVGLTLIVVFILTATMEGLKDD